MVEFVVSDTLEVAIQRNPHLGKYLEDYRNNTQRTPIFYPAPDNTLREIANIDVIYPVGDPIFIHIFMENNAKIYQPIEPPLSLEEQLFLEEVMSVILNFASDYPPPENDQVLERNLDEIF
jgi:flagellar protein FlaI